MRRALRWLVVALLVAAVLGVRFDVHATTWTTGCENTMVSHINGARKAHGLRPYKATDTLQYYARNWSLHMAREGYLSHDPNLARHYKYWTSLGQNVGKGRSCSSVWSAFMNSPEHRANILDRHVTQVGVGVYFVNGTDWVTQDFREP